MFTAVLCRYDTDLDGKVTREEFVPLYYHKLRPLLVGYTAYSSLAPEAPASETGAADSHSKQYQEWSLDSQYQKERDLHEAALARARPLLVQRRRGRLCWATGSSLCICRRLLAT